MTSNAGVNATLGDGEPPPGYVITHHGPVGTHQQRTTAAAYYARKGPGPTPLPGERLEPEGHHVSAFGAVLRDSSPPVPSSLAKKMESGDVVSGLGKVRVVLRVQQAQDTNPHFQMDKKKKQLTLLDPSTARPAEDSETGRISAPKMFAFDGLFTSEDSQAEVSASALTDAIHSVVNGTDGCLFCFGHASLGKTYTMVGSDEGPTTLGVIPTAIAWLYKCIKRGDQNHKYEVKVSAAEIGGSREELKDLLSDQDGTRTSCGASGGGGILQSLTEVNSATPERAGFYLDSALTARSTNMAADFSGKDSHFLFTLHIYQYLSTTDKAHLIGSRSRLHLIDFGGCERTKKGPGSGITLSGLGNVILGIFNGQRHLPCKESRVTQLLKECLGSLACQATMLAHVSPEPCHYSETLHTTQLASRIHRMRRKKAKSTGGSGGGSGSGSSDEKTTKLVKLASSSSDMTTDPSSSEQSCDTVIYVGSRDDEGTDAEHPPVYIPNLNCVDARGQMAHVLRGSTAELPKHTAASSTLERKKSPANLSKVLTAARTRPGSCGSTPVHRNRLSGSSGKCPVVQGPMLYNVGRGSLPRNPKGKMPLHGRVAGYRQQPVNQVNEYWLDQQFFQPHMCQHPVSHDYPLTLTAEQQAAIYGYMDDHKKNMIAQWVECQSRINPRVPPVHPCSHHLPKKRAEPEPFAWLNHPSNHEDENGCKMLTQFKTAESSEESLSDSDQQHVPKSIKKAPSSSSGGTISITAADVHIQPRHRTSSIDRRHRVNRSSQLIRKNNLSDGERTSSLQRPHRLPEAPRQRQVHKKEYFLDEARPAEPVTEVIEETKDVEDIKETKEEKNESEREESEPAEDKKISSLDELYTHCEQLVETLSQASEELRHMQTEDYLKVFQRKTPQKETTSDENLCPPEGFDGNSLHYATKGLNCDSISVNGGEELDQLSKLHQLYQSVSSISAKSQINLQRQKEEGTATGSHKSLTALFQDLERISLRSEVNSLCSEPVKLYDYNDFNELDNGGFTAASMADIFGDICGNQNDLSSDLRNVSKNISKSTVSLCDIPTETKPANFASTVNVNERSDSPILAGIDKELAKYAKLKDLEKAYKPPQAKEDLSCATAMLRHPDGASNPDLKTPSSDGASSGVAAARRSPGNGRSGSEPDDVPFEELPPLPRPTAVNKATAAVNKPLQASISSSSSLSTSCSGGSNQINNNATYACIQKNRIKNKRLNNNTDCDTSSDQDVWPKAAPKPPVPPLPPNQTRKPCNGNKATLPAPAVDNCQNEKTKGPRFSRLFKLSRSPLKIVKVNEDKKRSKSLDQRKAKPPAAATAASNINYSSSRQHDNSKKESKNAQGTSSHSEPSTKTFSRRFSHQTAAKQQQQQLKPMQSEDASSAGSGYESGGDRIRRKRASSSFLKTCRLVSATTNGRGAKQVSEKKERRAAHCKSSGYESCSNGEREEVQVKEVEAEELTVFNSAVFDELKVVDYDETFIDRLDKRWRFDEVRRLRQSQTVLKEELKSAKEMIHADPKRWSFELHVEENLIGGGGGVQGRRSKAAIQETDPTFVEALAKETSILKKRVDACKYHAVLQTCFDFKPLVVNPLLAGSSSSSSQPLDRQPLSPTTQKLYDNCCTTTCDLPQDIIIPSSQETEIF